MRVTKEDFPRSWLLAIHCHGCHSFLKELRELYRHIYGGFFFFTNAQSTDMKRFLGKDVCSVTRFTSGHSTQEKMYFYALHIQRFVWIGYHIQGMNFLARWANGWNLQPRGLKLREEGDFRLICSSIPRNITSSAKNRDTVCVVCK